MSEINNNIKNASQCVMDWVLDKGYTNTSCAESIVSSHPGVDCVGTLVASDIANKVSCEDLRLLSDRVTVVENADGLYCTGTLVPSDLDTINQDITELKNCASITGILTTDVFSLSGNTLVITF